MQGYIGYDTAGIWHTTPHCSVISNHLIPATCPPGHVGYRCHHCPLTANNPRHWNGKYTEYVLLTDNWASKLDIHVHPKDKTWPSTRFTSQPIGMFIMAINQHEYDCQTGNYCSYITNPGRHSKNRRYE